MNASSPGACPWVVRSMVAAIKAYRRVSRYTPPTCRFTPTCSEYAIEALHRHGALKGSWLAMRRIGRCHPFSKPGHDPVP